MTTTEDRVEWTRFGAPLVERISIGLLYTLSAIVFLALQISVTTVFIIYKDFRTHPCYRIMIVLSIVDSVQLVVHAYGGLIVLCDNSFNAVMEKVLGGLLNSFAVVLWPLGVCLALNRLLVFCPPNIGTQRAYNFQNFPIFIWLMFFSLMNALPLFLIYLTPHSSIVFREYSWDYLRDNTGYVQTNLTWKWVQEFSETEPLPYIFLNFLVYIAIFVLLLQQRIKMSKIGPARANNPSAAAHLPSAALAPHERRLLLQALIQFGVEALLCSIWFWQMANPTWPEFMNTIAFTVFINWYWIFYNGFKPIIYVALNRTIRVRFLLLWHLQKEEAQTVIIRVKPAPGRTRTAYRIASSNT